MLRKSTVEFVHEPHYKSGSGGKVAQILVEVAAFDQIDLRDEEIFLYAVKNTSKIHVSSLRKKILDTVRACLSVRKRFSLLFRRFFSRRPGGTYLGSVMY